jgi:hypothetical protein
MLAQRLVSVPFLWLVISCAAMNVSAAASVDIERPLREVFDFCTRNDTYEKHLRRRGPVAGVAQVEFLAGDRLAAGGRRRVVLTDGSELEEVIIEHVPPTLHRYRWGKGLRGPFALLVRTGTGTWRFASDEERTRVEWGYDFELRSALAYPIALVIMPLFAGWLRQSLESIRDELEAT